MKCVISSGANECMNELNGARGKITEKGNQMSMHRPCVKQTK